MCAVLDRASTTINGGVDKVDVEGRKVACYSASRVVTSDGILASRLRRAASRCVGVTVRILCTKIT